MANEQVEALVGREYKHGFVTDVESDTLPPGLDEGVIRHISRIKGEPEFMLNWRLKAYDQWLTMRGPEWAKLNIDPIDYQGISYYSAPKSPEDAPKSLDEVDPKLLETYEKLGIPLAERAALAGVAVDAVFDSVSVATTFKDKLAKEGIIFCSFSEAIKDHPELIEKYLGTVVPQRDNFFAAQLRGVYRRLVCLHPQGCSLPDGTLHLLPNQRTQYGPVRADSDRRRRRVLRQLPGGLHSTTTRREPATRSGGRADRRGRRRSNTPPSKTGTPAMRTAKAAFTTLSRNAANAAAITPKSRGLRWKLARL